MHDQTEPIIVDPNSTVGPFSWECNAGMTTSYMNTNRDIMTDPMSQMVSAIDTTTESEVIDRKETAPEGADEGQTGDAGTDEDGSNFGQDQADVMSAEGDEMETKTSGSQYLGLGLLGVGAFVVTTTVMLMMGRPV
jgi:hypothetical protein